METTTPIDIANEFSKEFKLEMENSICNYFEKYNLEEKPKNDNEDIVREETLIDNSIQDIEYLTSKTTPSLKGISEFMIDQVFSTDKFIPIYESSDEENNEEDNKDNKDNSENSENSESTEVTENINNQETITDINQKKMSTCNSDVTLNDENRENLEEEDVGNETISKSFAVEFIDLFEMNMKELKSKKDDFHVIGLKTIVEEDETKEKTKEIPESPVVKIKEEFSEEKPKTSKKSKHMSFFSTIERKASGKLYRSKSSNTKPSKSSTNESNIKLKKSKSKLGFSKLFKSIKKRM